MPSNCARVIETVRSWALVPNSAGISRTDVLADLWLRHGQRGLSFCSEAANDLVERLLDKFRPAVHLRLKVSDFCPSEGAPLRTVGDVCEAVDESENG